MKLLTSWKLYMLVVLFSLFSIASNSIAVDAFNKNPDYKKDNMPKFGYLGFCLSASIIVFIAVIVIPLINKPEWMVNRYPYQP